MAVHLGVVLVFVWFSLYNVQSLSLVPPSEVFMDDECGSSLEVTGRFVLRLRNPHKSAPVREACVLDLQVSTGYRLNIQITSLNISSPRYPVCRNYLQIFDGSSTDYDRQTMTSRLCNIISYPRSLLRSEGRFVFLWFENQSEETDSSFEIIISPFLNAVEPAPMENAVYISIAVATSALLLAVIVFMCCCVYSNRKKELQRRRRRLRRHNIQMTLEVVGGMDNPNGPQSQNPTPPAYTPPTDPPPYSTLPRRHHSLEGDETTPETPSVEREETQAVSEHPPQYEDLTL